VSQLITITLLYWLLSQHRTLNVVIVTVSENKRARSGLYNECIKQEEKHSMKIPYKFTVVRNNSFVDILQIVGMIL